MPLNKNHNATPGVPNTAAAVGIRSFNENVPIFEQGNRVIIGVTQDSAGAALGGCTVKLFNAYTDVKEQEQISDASGNYSFVVDPDKRWYILVYKTGAPDVAGASVNSLVGT